MTAKSFCTLLITFVLLTGTSISTSAQSNKCTSTIKTVEANGAMLHYFECGEGDPVVFIHGSTGDLTWAGPHAQFLAPQYRAISYSRRYHWPNDPPQEGDTYALQLHVDDLAALITELDLGPAHVIGHSYGGYVALAFALEHPKLVSSLVLGEPPVLPLLTRTSVGENLLNSFNRRALEPAREAYEQGEIKKGLSRFLNGVIYPGWFEELPAEAQDEIVEKAGPQHRLELLTESSVVMPPITCDALSKFDHPTLLMTGEDSPAMFFLVTAELEKCLEGEVHIMVPEAGHAMFYNTSFFNESVQTFLEDQ